MVGDNYFVNLKIEMCMHTSAVLLHFCLFFLFVETEIFLDILCEKHF